MQLRRQRWPPLGAAGARWLSQRVQSDTAAHRVAHHHHSAAAPRQRLQHRPQPRPRLPETETGVAIIEAPWGRNR
jgi:hypothetical protein